MPQIAPDIRKPARTQDTKRPAGLRPLVLTIVHVVGTIIFVLMLSTLTGREPLRPVSYTEFKHLVRSGKVAEVIIGQDRIRGALGESGESVTTVRIEDPALLGELEQRGITVQGERAGAPWMVLGGWLLPVLLLVLFWSFMLRRAPPGQSAIAFGRSRAKIYAESAVSVTFADVAGIDEAVDELREIVDFLQHPQKYTALGGRIPKGVLLLGPPGTGKTLLARAVAGEAHVPFFSLSGSEFVEMFVGVGAARVRDLFAQAEGRAPCIVFIDELDALGKTRVASPLGTHEEREQTLNQLLAEMDGFDPRKGIIVMSATNRPEVLDPALLRPGRFDRQVVVDRPDVRGREAILRLHARAVKLAADVDLGVVAARTTGLAGADLANLVNEATLMAARRNQPEVSMGDFEEALDRVLAGLKRKRVMSAREREIVACHEAGHAIVASVLPGVDPVHKLSIVQRGYEALGHTLQLPAEERYLRTRQELLSQLAVWLGGRAAEEIAFQEVSTGGQNDLERASDVARSMVTRYGMSDTLGPVALDRRRPPLFMPMPGMDTTSEPFAEQTAREIDVEVKRLMTAAQETAIGVLRQHRPALDVITRRLLEHEVVEGDEVRSIVTRHAAPGPRAA
jgi:cell division protease FtsH